MDVQKEKALHESELLIKWLNNGIHGFVIPDNERAWLAAGCLDVALEHQKSIILLVTHKRYGSAYALARLIFEAFIRGVWLWLCASGREIEQFREQGIKKPFNVLVQEVEKIEGYGDGVLSDIKAQSWKLLNGFTHTGVEQVARRYTDTSMKPNYKDIEIVELLTFVNEVSIFTTLVISYMSKQDKFAESVFEKAEEFWDTWPKQEY